VEWCSTSKRRHVVLGVKERTIRKITWFYPFYICVLNYKLKLTLQLRDRAPVAASLPLPEFDIPFGAIARGASAYSWCCLDIDLFSPSRSCIRNSLQMDQEWRIRLPWPSWKKIISLQHNKRKKGKWKKTVKNDLVEESNTCRFCEVRIRSLFLHWKGSIHMAPLFRFSSYYDFFPVHSE